jgi:hypothetical protein
MRDYENQKWFELYREALLELEHLKMTGRIADARAGISARLEVLKNIPGLHREEQQSISDALSMLRTLEREEARFAQSEKKDLAEAALRKLQPIAPRIQGLERPESD